MFELFTVLFWKSAVERAVKTAAQAFASSWLVGDVALNALTLDWQSGAGIALGGALLSLVTSIASIKVGPVGSPSLVAEDDADLYGDHAAGVR